MNKDVEKRISDLEERAKADEPGVLAEATTLAGEYPSVPGVWSLRAYLFARSGNYGYAVSDVTRAMELSPPQPVHYFDRGRYKLKLGDRAGAVADFGDGLDLCEVNGDEYYRETLHFMRADALLRSGRKKEALADLAYVRDGFTLWTTELRSKEALLAECE